MGREEDGGGDGAAVAAATYLYLYMLAAVRLSLQTCIQRGGVCLLSLHFLHGGDIAGLSCPLFAATVESLVLWGEGETGFCMSNGKGMNGYF